MPASAGAGHSTSSRSRTSWRWCGSNLIGVLNGIHSALPLLKATPGSLCFTTSSSSATYGMPNIAVYSATKHAVKGLTEALSIEFRAFGVRAADTLPGLIDTAIIPREAAENAPVEGMFRLTPPSAVAQAVWEAYTSDKLHWYVPPEIGELDKAATLSPEAVREQLASGGLFNRRSWSGLTRSAFAAVCGGLAPPRRP